jgi:thermitase
VTPTQRGAALFLSGLLFAGTGLSHAAIKYRTASGSLMDATPQVIVKYKDSRRAAVQGNALRRLGATVVNVPSGQTLESMIAQLQKDPNVEYVEPNGVLRMFSAPNDPSYSSQYSLGSNYINAEAAWAVSLGTPSVVIAVIDTGITETHPDLVGNLWANPHTSSLSGPHGAEMEIDWDGDGQCNGSDPELGPEQCAGPDPHDDNSTEYHGTRVSGIIAAVTDNGTGMAGIARNCRIMAVKALNANGTGSFEAIAAGILYAVDNGASVINMSLGGTTASQAVADAVQYAFDHNVVVVAAAGNGGNAQAVNFPGSISRVIAVGATDSGNSLAYFSCTGHALDLVAPGVGILSAIPSGYSSSGGDGTSFSSPMVAGVAALLRSLDPNMSVDDVTRYIDFSATDLGGGGFDTSYGFGRLNAGAALTYASSGSLPQPSGSPGDTYPIPNPFRPLTDHTAQIILPGNLQNATRIEIRLFTIAGEHVRTLTNTTTWDGKNDDGSVVASGLYFYYADTSLGSIKGKVTVLK